MAIFELIANQLRKPSGLIGSLVMSRVLNRSSAPINQLALELLDLGPTDRVIEVGFGGGDLIERMASLAVEGFIGGVDFSPEMVQVCTRRFAKLVEAGRIELRCARAESLPYDSENFTKACTVNTIYFWPDPLGPLNELRRVLRDGGRLVVGFSPRTTVQKLPFARHGFTHYEPDQVQRLMKDAGFAGVETVSGSGRVGEFLCAVGTKL